MVNQINALNETTNEKIERFVIVSHGFEGGISGATTNSGVYTQATIPYLAKEEITNEWKNLDAINPESVNAEMEKMKTNGLATIEELAESLNNFGFTENAQITVGSCNTYLSPEAAEWYKNHPSEHRFGEYRQYKYDSKNGFANQLFGLTKQPVIASGGRVVGKEPGAILYTGTTGPYYKTEKDHGLFRTGVWWDVQSGGRHTTRNWLNLDDGSTKTEKQLEEETFE